MDVGRRLVFTSPPTQASNRPAQLRRAPGRDNSQGVEPMPKKGDVVLKRHPWSGRWEIRKHGNERATAVTLWRDEALEIAEDVAKKNDVALVIVGDKKNAAQTAAARRSSATSTVLRSGEFSVPSWRVARSIGPRC